MFLALKEIKKEKLRSSAIITMVAIIPLWLSNEIQ